jgi:hypothetical protein
MRTDHAQQIIDQLASWSIRATLLPRGLDRADVRVALAGGREAVWSVDTAAGLRAEVLRDGILVSFVPEMPGSRDVPPDVQAWLIATADYGLTRAAGKPPEPSQVARRYLAASQPACPETQAECQRPGRSSRWLRRQRPVRPQ